MIAFALNYIPFVGPLVAILLPTLFAVLQFGAWQAALSPLREFPRGHRLAAVLSGRVPEEDDA